MLSQLDTSSKERRLQRIVQSLLVALRRAPCHKSIYPSIWKALQTELSPTVADLPKHWHDVLAFTLVESTRSKHIYHFLYHRVLRMSDEVSSVSICYFVDGEPRSTCQALSGGTFEAAQLPSLQRDADSQSNAVNQSIDTQKRSTVRLCEVEGCIRR